MRVILDSQSQNRPCLQASVHQQWFHCHDRAWVEPGLGENPARNCNVGVRSTNTSHDHISGLPAKPPSLPMPMPPPNPSPPAPAGTLTSLLAPTLLPSAGPCTGLAVPGSGHRAMAAHRPACRVARRACVSPACAVRLLHGPAVWPCGMIGRWSGREGP